MVSPFKTVVHFNQRILLKDVILTFLSKLNKLWMFRLKVSQKPVLNFIVESKPVIFFLLKIGLKQNN